MTGILLLSVFFVFLKGGGESPNEIDCNGKNVLEMKQLLLFII